MGSPGSTVTEFFGVWRLAHVNLVLAVDNLFDGDSNEAQFATTSRLRDQPTPITELHFTRGPVGQCGWGAGYRF